MRTLLSETAAVPPNQATIRADRVWSDLQVRSHHTESVPEAGFRARLPQSPVSQCILPVTQYLFIGRYRNAILIPVHSAADFASRSTFHRGQGSLRLLSRRIDLCIFAFERFV